MGTSLTGKQIKNTYKSLIKISDNTEASASAKQLSDGNGNDFGVYIDTDGVFGIGSAPSYSLDVSSRNDGVALPVGTTANRPTGFNGLIRYNSTIGKVEFYDTGWKTIYTTSGGTISGDVTVTGDLIVQGTTVTLNTETVQFEDNFLLLNRASEDTQYNATSAGIEVEVTGGTNQSFGYTYSNSTWNASSHLQVSGDLTVDDNVLFVDSTNNRVGIGTTSPNAELEIHGNLNVGDGTSVVSIGLQRNSANYITATDAAGYLVFRTGGANERMRITGVGDISFRDTSNNEAFYWDASASSLGIGTTNPSYKISTRTTGTTSEVIAGFGNNNIEGGLQVITSDGSLEWGLNALNSRSLVFQTNQTERLRIDSSGRVGIGVTPSAWSSPNFTALQLGVGASIAGRGSAGTGDQIYISANTYYDGTTWRYIETNPASNYYQDNGEHVWRTAVNGSAGVATTFSERMRITNTGNVGIGESNPTRLLHLSQSGGGAVINIERTNSATSGTAFGAMQFLNSVGNSVASVYAISDTDNLGAAISFNTTNAASTENPYTGVTERMRIDSSGSVIVKNATTSGANIQLQSDNGTWTQNDVISNINTYISDTSGVGARDVAAIKVINEQAGVNTTTSGAMAFYTSPYNGTVTERVRITSGGRMGINETNPQTYLQIKTDSTSGTDDFARFDRETYGEILKISREAGFGNIRANQALTLESDYSNTWSSGNSFIRFKIDGSEKARILHTGGLTFNGDTAAANALDDYEEGTWTITYANTSNVSSLATSGSPKYTKIGNVVHLSFEVDGSFTTSTAESYFSFTLPFTAHSTTMKEIGVASFAIGTGADRFGKGNVYQGQTTNSKTFVYIPAREVSSSGTWIGMRVSLTYFTS